MLDEATIETLGTSTVRQSIFIRLLVVDHPRLSFVALYCPRSSQSAREDLPAGEPDELGVGSEIALPQLAGFHQEPPEPLEPHRLRPARSTPDEACQNVEAATHA